MKQLPEMVAVTHNNYNTDDLRICAIKEVVPPQVVHDEFPISQEAALVTLGARREIQRVLHGHEDRLLVVIGPCSIHDPDAALEYGRRLLAAKRRLCDELLIVMRVYFEKPRTTVGWKGLINDPDLDESFNINKGLRLARKLLLDLNEMGVPAATEYLDLITPQYVSDLIAWGRSARAPQKARCTASWRRVFPARWGSRTPPTAESRWRSMPLAPRDVRTISCR